MCGIVLLLDPNRFVDPKETLDNAMEAIAHRGLPGRSGQYLGDVYMGHVRLPIRGQSKQYDQPFETSTRVGMFVGEIFGIADENDAQYALDIVQKYEPYDLMSEDGFWNIVDHHKASNVTNIYMDHLAIKPLYYYPLLGVICSELRGIETASRGLDLDYHYLSNVRKWGYDPRGDTPYRGVRKLRAGYAYRFKDGRLIDDHRYFALDPWPRIDLKKAIVQATENRLVSDLPLGVLCSGGLDSTIVALLAARTGHKLTVFHVDNDEKEFFDMIDWPSNVEIQALPISPTTLEEALKATEEPVDLGSVYPQYVLGQAVRKAGYSVALSGDGADELFGGYRRAKEYDSQYSDIFTELVHYHLPRLDKTMMASTVELRSPFLAPDVIRGALAIQYSQRTEKQILKELFKDIVPPGILNRTKKPLRTKDYGEAYRWKIVEDFIERKKNDQQSARVSQAV